MVITFYSDNLVDQANITADSENLQFPLINIKDQRRTKVFRSTENNSSVVFDLMETSTIDSFLIVSNPNDGFGVSTVTIEANATNEWSSPAFTTTLPFSIKHGIGLRELDTAINFRFVRFVLTSSLGYCELSNVFIGKKTKPGRGLNYGWSFKDEDLSEVKLNRYDQQFADLIGRQRIFNGIIQNLDDVNLELLFSVTDKKGKVKPLFVKIGCADSYVDPYRFIAMVFFQSIPTNTQRFYKNFGFPVALKEAR